MQNRQDNSPPSNPLYSSDTKMNKMSHTFFETERPEQPIGKKAKDALGNADEAIHMVGPKITAMGIEMMSDTGGYLPLAPLGLPVAIGGIVLDSIITPVALVVAAEESVRAGILKLTSLIFEKPPVEEEEIRLFKSFIMKFRETATLLVELNLEPRDVLDKQLKTGDIAELIGLTLLHTAYTSRHQGDRLLLANHKKLYRQDCPAIGLPLFDNIMELKKLILSGLELVKFPWNMPVEEKLLHESEIAIDWIRLIKEGKQITAENKPDATEAQLLVVNKMIEVIEELKKKALSVLPEDVVKVAKRVR